jgi:hypothetical protein
LLNCDDQNSKVVRIGVTGHRFLAEILKLETGIDQALDRIDKTHPHQSWSIISSLAEGADRLVVQRVWQAKPAAGLIVPLPLPISEYIQDFSAKQSQTEFEKLLAQAAEVIPPPQVFDRNEGYWLAGKTMLDRCTVLIALWDGRPPKGQGGTGQIVLEARQRGLPIAWVYALNNQPGVMDASASATIQATVTYENFPAEKPPR